MMNKMIYSMPHVVHVMLHTATLNEHTQLKQFCWCHNFTHGCPSTSILRRLRARCRPRADYKRRCFAPAQPRHLLPPPHPAHPP